MKTTLKNRNFLKFNGQAFLVCLFLSSFSAFAQNIAINETGAVPQATALLDVDATNKGILVPRMTTVQRDAITSPADALPIFNTTIRCFEVYNSTTSIWTNFGCFPVVE